MIRSIVISCVLSLYLLLPSITVTAQTITMDLTGPAGNNSGGVYTYPYDFTLNGSGSYQLMCTTFNREITNGESWAATTLGVSDLNATTVQGLEFPSAGVEGYLEASYLFVEEVTAYDNSNSDSEGLYNWAVWDLLLGTDPSASALSTSDQAAVQSYLTAAQTLGNNGSLTTSQFSNVVVYTPTDLSPSGPQEFMGYGTPVTPIPEPSTVMLTGLGVAGLLGICRRRK